MKNTIAITLSILLLTLGACKKPDTATPAATEAQVLGDFANVVVSPNYQDIQNNANSLNEAIIALSTSPTDDNLAVAQTAWRSTRAAWESCEGFLLGPVEDYNYDPSIDTWPLDKSSLDSLLASSNPLTVSNIDSLDFSLKGFHAIEYIIFGSGGGKTASQIDARQMQYLVSLGQSLYNTTTNLRYSWDSTQAGNFATQFVYAGTSRSTRFASRKDAFLALVAAMSDICNEVGTGKMQDPLGVNGTPDSTLDESSFSHNSTADFKYNITGVLNAYMCQYIAQGHGLHELVAAKNLQLDNTVQQQINAAINSFSSISSNYEQAIYTQRTQIQNTQNAIATLKATLDGPLTDFINTNIKD